MNMWSDHVSDIQGQEVLVVAQTPSNVTLIQSLGGKTDACEESTWRICFHDDDVLALILQRLMDAQVPFGNWPWGWPPAAVVERLREMGKVQGQFREMTFPGGGRFVIRDGV